MYNDILIKCLRQGGRSVHSFVDAQGHNSWDLPRQDMAGDWKGPVEGLLAPHHNGLHLAKKDCLIDWLTGHHYIAETSGETVEGMDCVVARRARLIEHLPVNDAKIGLFCDNQIALLPEIMTALDVYPSVSKDVKACVDVIRQEGLTRAHHALDKLPEYKYVRQKNIAQSYDALHSIEYYNCTHAAKSCLETVVAIRHRSRAEDKPLDFAKLISNKVATSLNLLHVNYHFMQELCNQGYNHRHEVKAMEKFLSEKELLVQMPFGNDEWSTLPIVNFFPVVRKRQNKEILPALGL